jgi:hypothetical protein
MFKGVIYGGKNSKNKKIFTNGATETTRQNKLMYQKQEYSRQILQRHDRSFKFEGMGGKWWKRW